MSTGKHLYSFGSGQFGKLGTGNENNQPIPVKTEALPSGRILAVSAGLDHSCAIIDESKLSLLDHSSGSLYVWGSYSFFKQPQSLYLITNYFHRNSKGQIGIKESECYRPVSIFSAHKFRQVKCSIDYTLLLSDEGNVYSMGQNTAGQCGYDPTQQSHLPGPQKVPGIHKIKHIFAQSSSFSAELTATGELYFFGAHPGIKGLVGSLRKFDELTQPVTQVICGLSSAAALTTSKTVLMWGDSQNISSDLITSSPTELLEMRDKNIAQISGIGDLFVFVSERGRVYILGAFGDCKSSKPQIVRGRVSAEIIKKSSCSSHDILLLSEIGDVFQWNGIQNETLNNNHNGSQNSPPTYATSHRPTEPQFSLISSMEDKVVVDVCSGLMHSVLLTSDGLVYCIGSSEVGQLGIGHKVDLTSPILVSALSSTFVTQIAAGRVSAFKIGISLI